MLPHLLFHAFDAIKRAVEAGSVHRLQEGPDCPESAVKFPTPGDTECFAVRPITASCEGGGEVAPLPPRVEFKAATNHHRPAVRPRS